MKQTRSLSEFSRLSEYTWLYPSVTSTLNDLAALSSKASPLFVQAAYALRALQHAQSCLSLCCYYQHPSKEIFAHWIRISEILPWDRKSYLIQAILPRLSCEAYIHWLYWNSQTWSSSDVIVMFEWRHHVQFI